MSTTAVLAGPANAPVRGRLTPNAPLAPLTWFKTGGAAEWLFEPADADDLAGFLARLDPVVPVMALGLGSNLIVRDGGVPGVVVRLGKPFAFARPQGDGATLTCGGGTSGILASSTARDAGLAGLEFLRSIPGTVGGFVRMNGGAYGARPRTCWCRCASLPAMARSVTLPAEALGLSATAIPSCPPMRSSWRRPFRGTPGDPAAIGAEMDRIAAAREASAAAAQQDRRLDLQEPAAGHKAWELVDRGRLPRLAAGRRAGEREAHQFPHQHWAARPAPRSRRWARTCGGGCASRASNWSGRYSGWAAWRNPPPAGGGGRSQGGGGRRRSPPSAKRPPPARWSPSPDRGGSSVQPLHIVVLMGGWSAERECRCRRAGVADALDVARPPRHRASTWVAMSRKRWPRRRPTSCSTRCTARRARTARVQGMMDLMGLTYTHSAAWPPRSSRSTRSLTKQALVPQGMPMPGGRIVPAADLYDADPLPRPYVLKPVNEGSSVGVAIVTDEGNYGNPIAPRRRRAVAGIRRACWPSRSSAGAN